MWSSQNRTSRTGSYAYVYVKPTSEHTKFQESSVT